MDFLSADGFPITLDGVVEFRVLPQRVAEVFVQYNEDPNGDAIDEEIITKIITPESRSLCRIGGSKLSGGQFISGDEREKFQRDLVQSLTENCKKQGIEILAVAITSIKPPEEIAEPVRLREVAKQQLVQYQQEKMQQLSEAQLRVQQVLAEQKKKLVEAEQGVVEKTTRAEQDQQVAMTLAGQKLKVAETQLAAAKDQASAVTAKAQAEADVIRFNNKAELAGLSARVAAFDGDGGALARNILIGKLAPSFQTILSNSEGPLMDLFSQFTRNPEPAPRSTPLADRAGRPGPVPRTRRSPTRGDGTASTPVRRRGGPAMNPRTFQSLAKVLAAVALAIVVGYIGIWQWTICRVEVPPGSSLLLRYKGPWPFGSVPQAPEGTLAQTDPRGWPRQVRRPRVDARPGPAFLLAAGV